MSFVQSSTQPLAATASSHAPETDQSRPWLIWLMAILVLAAIISAAGIYMSNRRQAEIDRLVELQAAGRQLQNIWLDAENGQRGFLLTGSEAYLEPYTRAKTSYQPVMSRLQQALQIDPKLTRALQSIARLQGAKIAELDETIELYRQGRSVQALAVVAAGAGKPVTDQLRGEFATLDTLLAADVERLSQARANWNVVLWTSSVAALLASLFLALRQLTQTRHVLGATIMQRASLERSNSELQMSLNANKGEVSDLSSLLESIADSTPDAIYAKDLAGRLIFANKACLAIMATSREETIGRTVAELSPNTAEINAIMEVDRAVQATGTTVVAEESYTADGKTITFLSRKAPLRDADGTVRGLVGISTDITARKRYELAVFESEQRFKAAVKAVNGVLWTNNAAGEMVGDEPAWGQLTGQTKEQYQGFGWSDAVHPDDAQPTIDAWLEAVEQKKPFTFEHRVRRHDGKWRLFAIKSTPVFDQAGEIIEWVGVHIDITDERETQQRLATALDHLNLALEAGQIGTCEIDLKTRRIVWDERMFTLWGMEGQDAPLLDAILERVHVADRPIMIEQFDSLNTNGPASMLNVEFRITRESDGQERWLAAQGRIFPTRASRHIISGTTRDITERKRRDEQIQFLMGELTHRTKNILAVIQSIARQTARNATSVTQFGEDFSERVNGIAASLDLLIRDNWKSASLVDLVQMQTMPIAGDREQRLRLSGADLRLRADAAQNLGLALHELSTNAAKYGALTTPTGYIDLAWSVETSDTGTGIFSIVWKERGGPPVVTPRRKGFGHTVMERLVTASLAGESELVFDPDGVRWSLKVPAEHVLHV